MYTSYVLQVSLQSFICYNFLLWIDGNNKPVLINGANVPIHAFHHSGLLWTSASNMTSFFRFASKRANYPFGIISLAHALVNVTDFSIGCIICVRHFSANVNINHRLPIKAYYRSCTLRDIRIEINYRRQNVLWVLSWIGVSGSG